MGRATTNQSDSADRTRTERLLLSVVVCVTAGIVEWFVVQLLREPTSAIQAHRTLAGVAFVYGAFGLLAGLPAFFVSDGRKAARLAVAVPIGALAAAVVSARAVDSSLVHLASAALGLVVASAALRVLDRLGSSATSLPLWSSAMAVLVAFSSVTAVAADIRAVPRPGLVAVNTVGLLIAGFALGLSLRRRPAAVVAGWLGAAVMTAGILYVAFAPVGAIGATASGPSVLLVTIDTLRADRLGAYGYARARTPNLDALAVHGTLFRHAVAHTYLTGPSHATILTGRVPQQHRLFVNSNHISDSVLTAAEMFGGAGYTSAAFVSGYPIVESASGLPSRFEYYDDDLRDFRYFPEQAYQLTLLRNLRHALVSRGFDFSCIERQARAVVDSAVSWLGEESGPFFMWVHFYDPHLPYEPPREFWSESALAYSGPVTGEWYKLEPEKRREILSDPKSVEQMHELYDAEIAYVDHELGRLLEAARARSSRNGLVTVVTADHGESMGEHDLYWARDLYDPTLLVPLLVQAPDVAPGRVEAQVRHIDILPTLLDLAGLPALDEADGKSLVALMRNEATASTGPAVSQIYADPSIYSRPAASIREDDYKLIKRGAGWPHRGEDKYVGPATELYDLKSDPGEKVDIAQSNSDQRQALEAELRELVTADGPRDEAVRDPQVEERLRALGYVD